MFQASQEYMDSMKKPLRNHSYMIVSLGLINQDAQRSASLDNQEKYIGFSNFGFFNENWNGNHYATYEQDFFKVDGSMVFLPDDETKYRKHGLISSDLFSGEFAMKFAFGRGNADIKGLTLQFSENYPTAFSVTTDSGVKTDFVNDNSYFETDTIFLDTSYLVITVTEMKYPNGRVRLNYIKFGIGIEFSNDDIKSGESNSTLSVIDEDLPQVDFSVTIFNEDQDFDVDNPNSIINFLETGQAINVSFGYGLDDGSIEWMQFNRLYLTEWKADNTVASIKSADRFQFMNDSYYKGKYYENGISLYDLAELVFEDAGIGSDEYVIDEYLKDIVVKNPLPNVGHKEALQIIANAGMCILGYDRYGKIIIYKDSEDDTGYRVEYDDLFKMPVGTQIEKIKNLKVSRTMLSRSTNLEVLVTDTVYYEGGNLIYYFDSPCYVHTIDVDKNVSVNIVDSGSYFIEFNVEGLEPNFTMNISINGYWYNSSTAYQSVLINETGNDKEWNNPLISDADHAKNVSEWLAGYFASDVEYDIDFRGDPVIDVGDTITQDNKYNENLEVVIEEIQLKFEQSISSSLKTRRKKNVVRAKNRLASIV